MSEKQVVSDARSFLSGGGEMGERLRGYDWRNHPLGPPESWPQSLKTILRVMLSSRYQMFVWWGKELWYFYNDAYVSVLGKKHPHALGQRADLVWGEVWDVLGPQTEQVLHEGRATWNVELPLTMERNGYPEEVFFTFSYSPVPGDHGGVGGVFCACTEDTIRVLGERRLGCLRRLGARTTSARTRKEACEAAADVLREHPRDVSLALLYLFDDERTTLELAASAGIEPGSPLAPRVLPSTDASGATSPVAEAISGASVRWTALAAERALPGGAWPEPTDTVVVVPLAQGGSAGPAGIAVLGASPRSAFDDGYRGFFDLLGASLSTAIANATAFEQEKRRAEALAELDRAKTAFFSNVSHEFRTPLTLMLGPLEDTLRGDRGDVPAEVRRELELVQRNGLRLQKLVNTLLEFSRIEARRVEASFEPTDLAAATAELASAFRSAIEKAGLRLVVECGPLPERVHVDRDMWEKVVLNLLSNAFKFTLEGEIRVSLCSRAGRVVLAVSDTGSGIPEKDLPHLFERFYRVEGAEGRTHEGSGIGLALVHELARLHGGDVTAESELGRGSTFTVSVPFGTAHLPPERVRAARRLASTAVAPEGFVQEALRWLPSVGGTGLDSGPARQHVAAGERETAQVLVVDDNADMRQYLERLLADRYRVTSAADGEQALAAIARERPDLVLTDVMMPKLDGFGLLRALRAGAETRALPVILLSARAGEEATVEGLDEGADDYLVKPFSARELLARVGSALELARVRREAEALAREGDERARRILESLQDSFIAIDRDWRIAYANHVALEIAGLQEDEVVGYLVWDVFPKWRGTEIERACRRAVAGESLRIEVKGPHTGRWFEVSLDPTPEGFTMYSRDISARVEAEAALRWRESQLRLVTDSLPVLISYIDAEERYRFNNRAYETWFGRPAADLEGQTLREVLGEVAYAKVHPYVRRALSGEPSTFEALVPYRDGGTRHVEATYVPDRAETGEIRGCYAMVVDTSVRKRAEDRNRFLVALDDAIRPLTDPDAITAEAARLLGLHLEVNRCAYADVEDDQDTFNLTGNYNDGVPSIVGRYTFAQFGEECRRLMRAGEPYVVADSETDPRTQAVRDSYRATQIRAVVCVAILKAGRFTGAMAVHQKEPREWRVDEVELVQNVADRCWESIERARVARSLRESEERFRQIAQSVDAVFYVTDMPDLRVRYVSPAFERLWGFDPDDLYRNHSSWIERIVTQDRTLVAARFDAFLTGGSAFDVEYRIRLADGSERWVRDRAAVAARDASGTIARITGIVEDVTALRAREEERRFLLDSERAARIEAQRATRLKDEFVATLSHELRTPINAVLGWAQLGQRGALASGEHAEAFDVIERNARIQAQLINDLLDVSRIVAGKLRLDLLPIDPRAVVEDAIAAVAQSADAKEIEIEREFDPATGTVSADPARLQQIVWNLLSNAIKFTPRGGRIVVSSRRSRTHVEIRVTDSGSGIEPEFLPHLFERFRQADSSTTRRAGGLGLGLAIAKQLIELHGGSIEAASRGAGRGASFVVTLPVFAANSSTHGRHDDEDVAGSGRRGSQVTSLAGVRVLVVDDEPDARELVRRIFAEHGAEVITAGSVREAIEAIARHDPAVLVSDIGMPDEDGYELLKQVRSRTAREGGDLPAVALTAFARSEDKTRALMAGFQAHVTKPVEAEELCATVASLLGRTGRPPVAGPAVP